MSLGSDAPVSRESDLVASSEQGIAEIEQEIAQLSEIVTSKSTLLGGEDVAELLKRLTDAESMAEGMESKLDLVLQSLDNLLGQLDNVDAGKAASAAERDEGTQTNASSENKNDTAQ